MAKIMMRQSSKESAAPAMHQSSAASAAPSYAQPQTIHHHYGGDDDEHEHDPFQGMAAAAEPGPLRQMLIKMDSLVQYNETLAASMAHTHTQMDTLLNFMSSNMIPKMTSMHHDLATLKDATPHMHRALDKNNALLDTTIVILNDINQRLCDNHLEVMTCLSKQNAGSGTPTSNSDYNVLGEDKGQGQ